MATPSKKAEEYVNRVRAMQWPELELLWNDIDADSVTGWDSGKAFEYFVVRAFELSLATVEYPYDTPPGGSPLEQIDGYVDLEQLSFIIECKDKDSVDITAIAKLHSQLHRRPPSVLGAVFVTGSFTPPALLLADMLVPHRIALWSNEDITVALSRKDFAAVMLQKYRIMALYGLSDYSPTYRDREV